MAFNNEIRVLNTSDTNHADNFNEPMQQLLENTQFNAKQIGVLPTLKTTNKEDLVKAINENVDGVKCLNEDRGYGSTKFLSYNTDFYDIPKKNGKYMLSTKIHAPLSKEVNYPVWYFVDVTIHTEKYIEYKARTFAEIPRNREFTMNLVNGEFGEWRETPTSDEITSLQTNGFNGKLNALSALTNMDLLITPNVYHTVIDKSNGILNLPTDFKTGITRLSIYVEEHQGVAMQKIIAYDGANKGIWVRCIGCQWINMATTDKIDILFTGSSKNGDVTLSNAYTNYNYLILAFGYDAEQVTQVINIYNASNPVKTKLVNGIRRIYPFNGATNIGLGNGTTLNMFSLDSKVILLGVYGVLIGG